MTALAAMMSDHEMCVSTCGAARKSLHGFASPLPTYQTMIAVTAI